MRAFFTLLLLSTLAVSAFAGEAELLAAGRAALQKGDFAQAGSLFEKAVAANPKSAEAHYLRGRAYGAEAVRANVLKQASLAKKVRGEFERAVELDPNHIDARQALVEYYTMAPGFMGGSNEKALAQAAEIKKRDALQGHRAYSRIYLRDKKVDLARKELVDAVREQPDNPRGHQTLGMFLMTNDKNYPSALHEFEMAQKLDPKYMPPYLRIGQHAALTGTDFARGEASIRKYLAYKPADDEPNLGTAWYWLGMLYEKQGRKVDAKQSFTNALRIFPDDKNVKEALKRVS
jgi:tetratricopeptide (TPR) repeat protein